MPMQLRYAFRNLLRNPGFSLLAVVAIGLGTGVNCAVFSVIQSVLLKSLPYPHAERLVRFNETKGQILYNISYPNFQDWRRRSASFEQMAIYNTFGSQPVRLPGGPALVPMGSTSWNLFSVLGARPLLGRMLTAADDLGDGADVAVISYDAWGKYFARDPQVVGKQIALDGTAVTVVGVLREEVALSGVALWFPRGEVRNPNQLDRGNHPGFQAIGRLKPGVSIEQARVEINGIAAALEREYPASNKGFRVRILPMLDALVMRVRPMLWILFGAVGFVLLIACANVANLLLVRTLHRGREFALRAALGASRSRIAQLVIAESPLIAIAGTVLGLLFASWSVGALVKLQPNVLPAARPVGFGGEAFIYTALLSLVSTCLFGLLPAWRASRGDLAGSLKQGRGATASKGMQRLRAGLVAAEVALSLSLLAGASLMIRSLAALENQDLGFNAARVLAAELRLPYQKDQTRAQIAQSTYAHLDAIRSIPRVASAAAAWPMPETNAMWAPTVNFADRPRDPGTEPAVNAMIVTPGYFKAMGIPLLRGRVFNDADLNVDASNSAIVSESYARKFYSGEDVLGKRVRMIGAVAVKGWKEIVGVVGDTRVGGLGSSTGPQVYWPYGQVVDQNPGFVMRASGDPASLTEPLRRATARVNAETIVVQVQPMTTILAASIADRRFIQILLAIFAALALALASIGIYGLVAFWVAQRTQEVGIRVALGASSGEVFRMVLVQTALPTGIGIAAGLGAAGLLTPLLASQIYGVTARDPIAFGAAALALGMLSTLAALLPARRAVRVDPIAALRQE
jgi:putative ABC transport system permease protein